MQEHRLALKPGYQLDHFRIEAVLGKGGFGITYLALDLRLGKKVAIKELLPDTIATRAEGYSVVPQSSSLGDNWQWARERFLEEARILAGFSHPSIVGVHLLMEAHGTVYMVMDYLEGESYEARLKRIGREPDQASLMSVMGPILNGLEEVHAKGLLHRDIKPENILINARGNPVLIDFGSARESVGKTMTMTSIVTHGYSPIEQYQTKGRMGPWTDIYAMGAVMCRAMTGDKPSVAADRLMNDDFAWLSYQPTHGYSDAFRQAVDWSLRVKPEERPQSVRQWAPQLSTRQMPQAAPPVAVAPTPAAPAQPPLNPPPAGPEYFQSPATGHGLPASTPAAAASSQRPLYSAIIIAALIIAMAVLLVAIAVIRPLMQSVPVNQQPTTAEAPRVETPDAASMQGQQANSEQEVDRMRQQQEQERAIREAAERARQEEEARLAAEEVAALAEEDRVAAQSTGSASVLSYSDALTRASAGDAYAQAVVSIYYDLGYKTGADAQKAVEFAVKSAEQGNPLGLYRLGVMRSEGKYMPQDKVQGDLLKRRAVPGLDSMVGDPYALTALGVLLHRGESGLARNWVEAARLYKLAADQGYAPAQLNISACYLSGKGVPKNETLGMQYWQAAYSQNYPLALNGPLR